MDKQREMFDEWWCSNFIGTDMDSAEVGMAWQAWQAAIETIKQKVPLAMRDPLSQASLVVQEWNEGAADKEEWGNEACQAIFALSNCINTLLIEVVTKTQTAIAAQQCGIINLPDPGTAKYGSWINNAKDKADQCFASHGEDRFKWLCQFEQHLRKSANGGEK